MIEEIKNFREKYPEYNDIDDLNLAKKLSIKYPEYNDLPNKVSRESRKSSPEGIGASLETIKSISTVYGPLETAASLASQIYGVPVSGLAAIAGMPFGKSREALEATQKALIYQPQTKAGQQLTEAVSYPFTKVGELSEYAAGKVTEKTKSPLLGTMAGVGTQTPLIIAGGKAAGKMAAGAFPSLSEPIKSNFYQESVNRYWAIEDVTKRAMEKGANIQPGENPALRARGYLGQSLKAKSVLEDKTFRLKPDGAIEITGEGLKPILEDYERLSTERNKIVKETDLNNYRIARRITEDLQRPKGEWTHEHIATPKQVNNARITLDRLNKKYGSSNLLEKTSKRLTDYEHRVLHLLVDSGNLSEENYQTIVKANPNYAPFERIMDNIEPEGSSSVGMGRRFTDARSPLKRIRGSEREIQNTVESTIKQTYRIMDIAERNTVARNVAKLEPYLPAELSSRAIEVYPIKVKPSEIDTILIRFRLESSKILRETKRTGGIQAPGTPITSGPMKKLETIVTDALKSRGMTEGEAGAYLNRIKESARGKSAEGITTITQTETIENTITKIIKETEKTIKTPIESTIFRPKPGKPKGNSIEYYDNGKRRLLEVSDNLYKAMAVTDNVSSGLLMKIASFPARLLRGGVTSSPEFMARNFFRDQLDGFIQSKVGFKPGIDTTGAIADVIKKSDVYYDYLRSGAGHTTFTELSRENLGRIVSELTKDKAWYKKLNVISHARNISEIIETGTRLGIYKAGIKKGLSPVEAAFEAREGTVDFGVRGASRELSSFSKMTAFFNPAIQGTDRFIRAHTQNPTGTFLKATATVTIPSVLLYLKNRNDPDYKELQRWDKDLFWHPFKIGTTFARIPKPFLFGAVYGSAVERFLEYLDTKDLKALDGFGRTILDASTPWSGDPASIFMVTGAKPLIENATNWSFFRERNIIPDYKKQWPEAEQYGKYTSEASKVIGKALDYSPAKIENIVKGYTGYMGQYGMDIIDLALKEVRDAQKRGVSLKGKRPKELADYPVIRAFITRPPESQSESVNLFYRQANEVIGQYESIQNAVKSGDMESAKNIQSKYPKAWVLGKKLTEVKQILTHINKMIDFVINDSNMSEDIKRENIKKLEQKKVKIAQIGNKILESRK